MNDPNLWLVYHEAGCTVPEAALDGCVTAWISAHAPAARWAELLDAIDCVDLAAGDAGSVPPPSRELLKARGLGVEEAAVLDRADRVFVVGSPANHGHDHLGLRAGLAVVRALGAATGGVIYDERRAMILPLDTPADRLQEGEFLVLDHVRVEAIRGEGGGWVTTNGLRLFGAPELELIDIPPEQLVPAACLLRFVAMFLATGGVADIPEALELPALAPDAPDVVVALSLLPSPHNGAPFLRVHPPGAPNAPLGSRIEDFVRGVVAPVFGSVERDRELRALTEPFEAPSW